MKTIVNYLVAIYLGANFMAVYSYIADIIINPSFSSHHISYLGNYLVYFILHRTWLFGLLFPLFALLFYKSQGISRVVYKILFIMIASLILTIIFNKKDLCFVGLPTNTRQFVIYFFTGISLMWLYIKYWHVVKNDIV